MQERRRPGHDVVEQLSDDGANFRSVVDPIDTTTLTEIRRLLGRDGMLVGGRAQRPLYVGDGALMEAPSTSKRSEMGFNRIRGRLPKR